MSGVFLERTNVITYVFPCDCNFAHAEFNARVFVRDLYKGFVSLLWHS